ncbi:MAG: VWA domain-containing protein [Deferribacteres bacterium]|nr:VWA domain-containing protein [candidate division KSB1 bacterium]MCB9500759.1 VWA domain-containing protein [Deferribacteres bacterium]
MIRFANPIALYFLLFIPAGILFYYFVFRWKTKSLQRFGNLELMKKLTSGVSRGRQKFKASLVLSGMFFLILALARPQIGTRLEEVQREGVDILVAVDVSLSMNAKDIAPSRLEKAKHEVGTLIRQLAGDRIGIIAFSGDAFLHCPLTLDYGAAKLFLDALEPGTIADPGTNINRAITVALNSFDQKERKYKVLILITDGENHGGDLKPLIDQAEREGVVIHTVGIGSPEGVPIPVVNDQGIQTGFKKDRSGSVVTTKLDELTLEKIALQTGGKYFRASGSEDELDQIYSTITKMEKKELGAVKFTQYEDRYQYFLLFALLLLLWEILLPERVRIKAEWRGRFR